MHDYDFSSAIGRLFAVTNHILNRPNIRKEVFLGMILMLTAILSFVGLLTFFFAYLLMKKRWLM